MLGTDADQARAVLEENREALELLYEGIDRGQLQFPEFNGLDQIPKDSETICKLGEPCPTPLHPIQNLDDRR